MSFEHSPDRKLIILQKLVEFSGEIQTLPECVLLLQQLLDLYPKFIEARQLLRAMEIEIFQHNSTLNKPIIALKMHALLARVTPAMSPRELISLAEEGLALNPYHPKCNQLLAKAALEWKLPSIAALAYETLCHDSNDIALLHRLAEIYTQNNDYVEAISVYDQILRLDPDDINAHELLIQTQRRRDAETAFAAVPPEEIVPNPGEEKAEAVPSEAPPPETTESLEGKVAFLESRLEGLDPDGNTFEEEDATAQEIASVAYELNCARLELAKRAFALEPENRELQLQLGDGYAVLGSYHEAIQTYEGVIEDLAFREESYVRMSRVFVQQQLQTVLYAPPEAPEEDWTG